MEVSARPIGADQHQRMNRVARRLLHLGSGELDALALRLGLELVADDFGNLTPVAVERRSELAAHGLRPVRPLPGRPMCAFHDGRTVVLETLEERLPLGVDGL